MLFNVPYVPPLRASLNLRNRVFLTMSKPGLMTARSSPAMALQARGALSEGLSGSSKSTHGKDRSQVTCATALSTNMPAALSTDFPSPCSKCCPALKCFHICREGMGRTKLFPQDKECNRLFYFPLSTLMMRSSPPGTAATCSTLPLPSQHHKAPLDVERRSSRKIRAGAGGEAGPRQSPRPWTGITPRSALEVVSTKANGGRAALLRSPKGKEEKKTNTGQRKEDGTKIQAGAVTQENASF